MARGLDVKGVFRLISLGITRVYRHSGGVSRLFGLQTFSTSALSGARCRATGKLVIGVAGTRAPFTDGPVPVQAIDLSKGNR